MFKRRCGPARNSNCTLFVAWLMLRGKLRGLRVQWTATGPHFIGLTSRGRYVHFRRTAGTPRVCSLWFLGVAEVYTERYAAAMAAQATLDECPITVTPN